MTTYYLTKIALSTAPQLAIYESESTSLRASMDCLVHTLFIEEKYDFIIQNQINLERALVDCGDLPNEETAYRYAKSEINRHFANVLTTTRLYVDQGKRFGKKLDRLFGEPLVQFEKRTNKQYDAKLGYRVMEALRNFVQHRGDAVHQVVFNAHKEWQGETMRIIKRTDTYLDPSELRKEKKFKSEVLKELEKLKNRPTAQEFLREYLEGLRIIHEEFRASTREKIAQSEACVTDAFERYRAISGDVVGLHVIEANEHGAVKRSFSVIDAPIVMRKFYESKNSCTSI